MCVVAFILMVAPKGQAPRGRAQNCPHIPKLAPKNAKFLLPAGEGVRPSHTREPTALRAQIETSQVIGKNYVSFQLSAFSCQMRKRELASE